MDYSEQIDMQISQALNWKGAIAADSLAGATAEEGATLLAEYQRRHESEQALRFDGRTLRLEVGEQPARQLSPVDQVMATGQSPRSLLDSKPAGKPYSKWIWWLALGLGLPGGVIGFVLVYPRNKQAAWAMLVVGLMVQLSGWLMFRGIAPSLNALSPALLHMAGR